MFSGGEKNSFFTALYIIDNNTTATLTLLEIFVFLYYYLIIRLLSGLTENCRYPASAGAILPLPRLGAWSYKDLRFQEIKVLCSAWNY
jgi:hypothetical protein